MHAVSSNGANIPALGFGTFRMSGAEVLRILPQALKLGFRHVDTAQIYGNEAEVGEAIQKSGIPRADVFLTTKVWVDNYRHDAFIASVDESLRKLRTDHVDLLLLHWPGSDVPMAERIGALNEVRNAGKVRHIGISNFNTTQMEEAARLSDAPIATNQVEYHPYLDQTKVLQTARRLGMSLTSYYAMANGKVPADPLLTEIGGRHGKTAAQVALRWLVQQQDVIVLSKTATEARLKENFAIFDFALTREEMAAVREHDDLARKLDLIESIDGIGIRTALTLVILMPELGRVDREEIAALTGVAPYDDQSGKREGERHIAGGRARVRRALFNAALPASQRWNETLVELYDRLTAKGKSHKAALIACVRKLIIFANTVVKRQTPWTKSAPQQNSCA